ncbi:MAG: hypothetical protein CMJ49_10590 [Planctomycetaceae bacterium]|nr:hypothetical protein [Planctomycetaceae bacterium]
MLDRPSHLRTIVVCLLLAVAVLVVYGQTVTFDFVMYDDQQYIYENPIVSAGPTWEGVKWAFGSSHSSNWHPVTWLSHMVDCALFGRDADGVPKPAGHHAMNVVIHLVNTLILLLLLTRMTGRFWPSTFVATMFAVHPLHVESVAWIAERKDLLSTLFGFLVILMYHAYTARGGAWRYVVMCALFALGLMAKPMLVTWPFVLLLLDVWPLKRMRVPKFLGMDAVQSSDAPDRPSTPMRSIRYLILEKIPLLAMTVALAVVTVLAQHGGGAMGGEGADGPTFIERGTNAIVSYVRYLQKMIWPDDLALFYPHPQVPGGVPWTSTQIGAAIAMLILITIATLWLRRRRYPLVGWLWYLGTLVPVIGLVQVGSQAMADRFTYIPLVGIFVVIAWGMGDVIQAHTARIRWLRAAAMAAAIALTIAATAVSFVQTQTWRDSITLFQNSIDRTTNNATMHHSLGLAYLRETDKLAEAEEQFRKAIAIDERKYKSLKKLGELLLDRGATREAATHLFEAMRHGPHDPHLEMRYVEALVKSDQYDRAERVLRQILHANPGCWAYDTLGKVLMTQGRRDEAFAAIQEGIDFARSRGMTRWLQRLTDQLVQFRSR